MVREEARNMGEWAAFWSYVHEDNEAEAGRILQLSEDLMRRVKFKTGDPFTIFTDRPHVRWGDDSAERLDSVLLDTTFLIPIVTPSYFKHEYCRKELFRFSSTALSLGLKQLILSIYYAEVPQIEHHIEGQDEAVDLIIRYQWQDFREVALEDRNSSAYRKVVDELAAELVRRATVVDSIPALHRPGHLNDQPPTGESVGPTPTPDGEEADEDIDLLDMLAEGEAALPRLPETLEEIGNILERMGEEAETATEQIGISDQSGKGFAGRLMVSKNFAKRLSDCADEFEPLVSQYIADLYLIDPMTRTVFRLLKQSPETAPVDFVAAIKLTAEAAIPSLKSSDDFATILHASTKFSKDLRAPSARIETGLRQLSESRSVYEEWLRLANEAGAPITPVTG
jgi:hypothetical protein